MTRHTYAEMVFTSKLAALWCPPWHCSALSTMEMKPKQPHPSSPHILHCLLQQSPTEAPVCHQPHWVHDLCEHPRGWGLHKGQAGLGRQNGTQFVLGSGTAGTHLWHRYDTGGNTSLARPSSWSPSSSSACGFPGSFWAKKAERWKRERGTSGWFAGSPVGEKVQEAESKESKWRSV